MESQSPSRPSQPLATPVQFIKGVGPRRAEAFEKLGLKTAADVLFHFPRDYEDYTRLQSIAQLNDGDNVTVRGRVEEVDQRKTESGGTVTGVLIHDGSDHLRGVWFNQTFVLQKARQGQTVLFSGRARRKGLFWEMAHPQVQWPDEEPEQGRLLPVYRLSEGLRQRDLRKAVRGALDAFAGLLEEVFPAEFLDGHDVWPLSQALPQIHFPENADTLRRARRRFVYQELFVLQLALALKAQQHRRGRAPPLPATAQIDARIRRLFPFELTVEQDRVINELSADMQRETPMNRLLQGDVGSGKTVVAVYGMLTAVAHRHQAALMAPTEVLSAQHFDTLRRLLAGSEVRLAELTGALTAAQRREMLARLAGGEIDVVVGTHALIQEDVRFARLGLVVIDEQHKFGVRQRATLKQAGASPHYLVMTATPIPRTTAMTQFGDLDISLLREAPPGRQQVHTYWTPEEQRSQWWDFFRRKLRDGHQGFVVTPRVEQTDMASVEEDFEALANGELEAFRVGLIHGRLDAREKQARMDAFRRGELQVLVCTTVVEVGVDVPAATLMTIENGERFGLSQLHQLRGRISRGKSPGFCTVFANATTEDARQRLQTFVNSTDGFHLAEVDFKLRGPGHLLGASQHGLPPLLIADLSRDEKTLEEARRDALELIREDPDLSGAEYRLLKDMVSRRYGPALELGDVG